MIHKKKQNNGKVNPAAAAVAGAAIGAVVTGAVALNNKKNRDKLKEVLLKVKDQAMGYMEDIQKSAKDKKEVIDEKAADGKVVVEEKVAKGKNVVKIVKKAAKDSSDEITKEEKK